MKIKQLKEKTIKGFIDFLPKIGIDDIPSLRDIINNIKTALNDKLSKSQGGEINKPIVVTNSNYSTTINPDGSIYVLNKSIKDNILTIKPSSYGATIGIEVSGRPLILKNVSSINDTGNMVFDFQVRDDNVYAKKFIKRYATGNDVLLGDGSTTDRLIKDVTAGAIQSEYNFNFIRTSNLNSFVTIHAATSTTAGVMTAADKVKLDDIENTYLPLSGGQLTGTLFVDAIQPNGIGLVLSAVESITTCNRDKISTPEVWTTDGNSIPLNKPYGIPTLNRKGVLNGYVSTVSGHIDTGYYEYNDEYYLTVRGGSNVLSSAGVITIERTDNEDGGLSSNTIISLDGKDGSIEAVSATFTNKVKANGFLANNNGNDYTAWTTNGESIDLIDLLSNAAIYVAGGFELAESGIDNTTVLDSPNSIIYDDGTKRFLARKGLTCYTHWNADISKNIAPPSRYGIETDTGVLPFNNQMYKFSTYDDIFIATCFNGDCNMKRLTINKE